MEKIKKTLLTLTITLCGVIVVLLLIPAADYLINGRTYSKIDKFFTDFTNLNSKYRCYSNYSYVMQNTRAKVSTNHEKNIPTEFSKDVVYDKAILSCNQLKKATDNLSIPEGLPEDKKMILEKFQKLSSSHINKMAGAVNKIEKCHSNIACLDKLEKIPTQKTFEDSKEDIEMNLAFFDAKKRFSYEYIFKMRPIINEYNKNLSQINKFLENYQYIRALKH